MSKTLDLHGLNVEQATSKVYAALMTAESNHYDQLEIVTGKGTNALKTVVENILEAEDFSYDVVNNGGSYIVYFVYDKDESEQYDEDNEYDEMINNNETFDY